MRVAAVVVAAIAAYALVGFFAVPPLVRWAVQTKGSEALHRRVTLAVVRFNPFTLEARARDLRIRDRDGQPLFSFGKVNLRLGPSGILQRAWRLRELTVEQPALQVRFLRDGKLSFADLFTNDKESKPAPRVIIDRLSIRGGMLDFADESASPPFRTRFAPLNADVRDLITIPRQRGEHALTIGFDRDSTIRIAGRQTLEPLAISGHLEVRRIALASLAQRLAPDAPLALRSGQADVAVDYDLRKQPSGVQLRVSRGELTATGLALASRENAELLTVPRVEVRGTAAAFPERRIEIGSIRVVDPVTSIGWNPQGRFNWSTSTATAAPAKKAEAKPASAPWTVRIAKAGLEGGTLHFDDQQTTTPVRFDLTGMRIDASGISNDTGAPVAVAADASTSGSGKLSLRGTLVPSPFALDLQSSLSSIELMPFQPYTASIRGLTLSAGSADFNGRMLFSSAQPFLIEGDGAANGVEFIDTANNRLLGCKSAALRQMRLDGSASRYRIRRVDLDGMYANVVIDKQRNLNLSAIGAAAPGAPPAPPSKGSFDIGTINLANSTIDYRDDSLVLPFSTAITSTKGTITDFSTTSAAAAAIRLDGNVAEHGAMSAQGTLRMADPFAGTDLIVHFRSVPMPVLTPYAAEFAGYEIVRGALDLDLRYRILNRKLNGDHRVVASDLTLGKKVSGSKAGLAVRLAIALLKDHDGKINLEVPIEGTIDSPEFNYRVVFWQAVKTILGNVVKAPFRALGHAMGIGGEDLQVVAFEPGDSTVIAPEAEKLKKIAGELAVRPELALEIEGPFDPKVDVRPMKRAKLEALLAGRRDAPGAGSLESILESLYSQAFSPDRLAQERAKFTTTPPPPPAEPARHVWQKKRTPPPPPPPVFDANGFYDAIRKELVEAQAVSADELRALGRSRAAAIAAALTSGGVLTPDRVRALDPAESKTSAVAKVVSQMKLSAKGAAGESDD